MKSESNCQPLFVMYANGIEMVPSGLTASELVDDGPRWLNHAVPDVRRELIRLGNANRADG